MAQVVSVTQLTQQIRVLLEQQLGEVLVEGEISNLRVQSSGHQYFTLKDARAQISCVLFRGNAVRLSQPLKDGMQVRVLGEISVYEQRGNYQIIARSVEAQGLGSLQAQFEALKQKLFQEGLFAQEYKQVIPKFPKCLALVTSATSAAVRDMLQILERRAPWLPVMVYPVRVQGQGAELEIVRAIEVLNDAELYGLPQPDVLIVGRGGGSLEDLWCFNEEKLARAIFASAIPIISAVGHEIDFTIADFVADLRAPTPSAAAELVAPEVTELLRHFESLQRRMESRLKLSLETYERNLMLLTRNLTPKTLERPLDLLMQRVDDQEQALQGVMENGLKALDESVTRQHLVLDRHRPVQLLANLEARVQALQQRLAVIVPQQFQHKESALLNWQKLLHSLGPDSVLARGYSINMNAAGQVLTSVKQLNLGDVMITQFKDGHLQSEVKACTPKP